MTVSNEQLVQKFLDGEENGRSSSMAIVPSDGGYTVLTGYGSCAYAVLSNLDELVIFGGWANEHVAEDAEDDWLGAHDKAGSHTVKAKHFNALPFDPEDKHVVVVSYDEARTALEEDLKERADVRTDSIEVSAPRVSEATDVAHWLLRERDLGKRVKRRTDS